WLSTSWSSSFDSCSSLIACCSEGVMISFCESFRWSFCSKAMVRISTGRLRSRSAQVERFAQVNSPDLRICRETFWHSLPENFTFFDDIGAIRDLQCFPHVVICDEDSDSSGAKLGNDSLNLEYSDWIDSCKGFI